MKDYESCIVHYEFEDRANFFMSEVTGILKDFPDLEVDVEDKTLADLEANSWAIKKSAELKKDKMNLKVFMRGREMEAGSANEATVLIAVHGKEKRRIREFEAKANEAAKHFQGRRIDENDNVTDFDVPEDEFKFFIGLVYGFRD